MISYRRKSVPTWLNPEYYVPSKVRRYERRYRYIPSFVVFKQADPCIEIKSCNKILVTFVIKYYCIDVINNMEPYLIFYFMTAYIYMLNVTSSVNWLVPNKCHLRSYEGIYHLRMEYLRMEYTFETFIYEGKDIDFEVSFIKCRIMNERNFQ